MIWKTSESEFFVFKHYELFQLKCIKKFIREKKSFILFCSCQTIIAWNKHKLSETAAHTIDDISWAYKKKRKNHVQHLLHPLYELISIVWVRRDLCSLYMSHMLNIMLKQTQRTLSSIHISQVCVERKTWKALSLFHFISFYRSKKIWKRFPSRHPINSNSLNEWISRS